MKSQDVDVNEILGITGPKDALVLESVRFRNFMSYGNNDTVVTLKKPGTTLIIGEDLDSGTGTSNGVGKTTILKAIVYALFDKPLSKDIRLDELINDINQKGMEVEINFSKGGKQYKIIRYRKGKEGNTVKLFVDGSLKTLDSVDATNVYIEEKILGYSYDLFVRIVVFSAQHDAFFSLPTSGAKKPTQTDIIEELLSITMLTQKAEVLKADIKDNQRKFEMLELTAAQIQKETERHEKLLVSTQTKLDQWDQEHTDKILATNKQLKKVNNIDYEKELAALQGLESSRSLYSQIATVVNRVKAWEDSKATKLKKIESDLAKVEGIDFDAEEALHTEIDAKKASLKEMTLALKDCVRNYNEQSAAVKKLNHEHDLLSDAKCPYCLQDYAESKQKAADIQVQLDSINELLSGLSTKKSNTEEMLIDLQDAIDASTKLLKVSNLASLLKMLQDAESSAARLVEIQAETNPHQEELMSLLGTSFTSIPELIDAAYEKTTTLEEDIEKFKGVITVGSVSELNELNNSKSALQSKLDYMMDEENPNIKLLEELKSVELDKVDFNTMNELDKLIEHQKFLVKLLTKSDSFIRKNIIDKNIPLLNQRLKKYLQELGLPHKVEFTNTMTASISKMGRVINYHSLSTGQRARINFALSFAFRDVLQRMHSPVNFCLLDEVLDVGLCAVGVSAAIRMLKRIAKEEQMTMFIITHKLGDEIGFDSTMKIELANGFSRIVSGN